MNLRHAVALPLLIASSPALAQEALPDPAPEEPAGGFVVGAHVGAAIPLTPLGAGVLPRLELGYRLPFLDGALGVQVSTSYSQHAASGSATNPQVPGGSWTWDLQQQVLVVAPGISARYPQGLGPVVPELLLAPEVAMLQSTVEGEASGSPFGESTEAYTRVGLFAALAGSMELGPGEAVLSLQLTTSALDGEITGDSTTAALAPTLGYRMVF